MIHGLKLALIRHREVIKVQYNISVFIIYIQKYINLL